MVGINMGRLGFMTELTVHDALERLPSYFNGSCRVEEHNMVQARLIKGGDLGLGEVEGPFHALNDVVLSRGAASRVVTLRVTIDDADVASMRADGIVDGGAVLDCPFGYT